MIQELSKYPSNEIFYMSKVNKYEFERETLKTGKTWKSQIIQKVSKYSILTYMIAPLNVYSTKKNLELTSKSP